MKRRFQGLHLAGASLAAADEVPDGLYLVQVTRAQYRWHPQKPFYSIRFSVLEPQPWAGHSLTGSVYCTPKALWKFHWFLRDFGYDQELLGHDEIEDQRLVGLQGIVKIRHTVVHGTRLLNLDGFAPARQWEELSPAMSPTGDGYDHHHDNDKDTVAGSGVLE